MLIKSLRYLINKLKSQRIRSSDIGLFDPYLPISSLKPLPEGYQNESTEATTLYDDVPLEKRNFLWFRLVILLIGGVITFRLIALQISHGQENYQLAEGNRLRTQLIPAPRGLFYDRYGVPLVKNIPSFSVVFQSNELPKNASAQKQFIATLAKVLEQNETELAQTIINNKDKEEVVLLDGVTRDKSLSLELKLNGLAGVYLIKAPTRQYADIPSLGHLLGYIGSVTAEDLKENGQLLPTSLVGKNGLERQYDSLLQGQPGIETLEVDSAGRTIRSIGTQLPQVGQSVFLGLDSELQKVAAQSLKESIEKNGATSGAAVALDTRTGEVLAMVSAPNFDGNVFARAEAREARQALLGDPLSPLINRAIAGQYPSGSTIKPVVLAAALEEKVIAANTRIDTSAGEISIGGRTFRDWKNHPSADAPQAIAESNNIYFYTVGGGNDKIKGLGVERLAKYMDKFGFGSVTNIDLPGEKKGNVPTPDWKKRVKKESWFVGDTYNMSIGQGDLLVTPLQLTRATAAIASGGQLRQPRMIKNFLNPNGSPAEVPTKTVNEQVVSPETIAVVKQGMRQAVISGSARSVFGSMAVEVAAKTGTAQTNASKERTHSWITSFAPYNNAEIAISVIVEGGGEGFSVAAPVAKNILEQYFRLPLTPIVPATPSE